MEKYGYIKNNSNILSGSKQNTKTWFSHSKNRTTELIGTLEKSVYELVLAIQWQTKSRGWLPTNSFYFSGEGKYDTTSIYHELLQMNEMIEVSGNS